MILQLDHLAKRFDERVAVNNVGGVHPGVYGLLGANGAGKTTLMRMICDVLRPDGGDILLNGQSTRSLGRALPRHPRIPAPGLRLLPRLHRHGLHALHGLAQRTRQAGCARTLLGVA